MKRIKFIQLTTLLLLASSLFSGGLITYSHFCSSEQTSFQSFISINHCSEKQSQELKKTSCSQHQLAVEQKCHVPKTKTKPCCEDKVEQKSNTQIAHSIIKHQFFPVIIQYIVAPVFSVASIEFDIQLELNKPPPLLDTQLYTRYQQFLL